MFPGESGKAEDDAICSRYASGESGRAKNSAARSRYAHGKMASWNCARAAYDAAGSGHERQ